MTYWAIAQVVSNEELYFQRWLHDREFKSVVILSKYWTKPKRKKKPIVLSRPAFRGYVFVELLGKVYEIMQYSPSYLNTIQNEGRLSVLQDMHMDELISRQDKGEFDVSNTRLVTGKSIAVINENAVGSVFDTFVGMEATVKLDVKTKDKVSLDIGGVTFTLPLAFVDIVSYA